MLTRTGRDAHTSQGSGQQPLSESSCTLALLRTGCPRPVVQHLHRSGEVGFGQAMGLAGGDSDLDSGKALAGDTGRRMRGLGPGRCYEVGKQLDGCRLAGAEEGESSASVPS